MIEPTALSYSVYHIGVVISIVWFSYILCGFNSSFVQNDMFLDRCCPNAKTAEHSLIKQLDILSFSDIWPCHVGWQLFTHCPYWWSSNGPDYSIGMRPSPTNMWASHNSPQASCFVTHAECWCEDDTVCAALENSIVVVPKVSYIFFHVPVQMFVLESAMLHFLTTICFALPVCLCGLQSDTWPILPAHS